MKQAKLRMRSNFRTQCYGFNSQSFFAKLSKFVTNGHNNKIKYIRAFKIEPIISINSLKICIFSNRDFQDVFSLSLLRC